MDRVIGIDPGDKKSHYCVLGEGGVVVEETTVVSTPAAFKAHFGVLTSSLIAMEVGVHFRWAGRVLRELDQEVVVANPVRLRLIHNSSRKSDRVDACALARLVRVDPELLGPVDHRSDEDQSMLAVLRVRDLLVRTRTRLVNCARGLVKRTGTRLPSCSPVSFANRARPAVPSQLRLAPDSLLYQIQSLTNLIKRYDRKIARIAETSYPATKHLEQIRGGGR